VGRLISFVPAKPLRARDIPAYAIDEAALLFYERHGFLRSPTENRLMLSVVTAGALTGWAEPDGV
jgi:hypothetical protein